MNYFGYALHIKNPVTVKFTTAEDNDQSCQHPREFGWIPHSSSPFQTLTFLAVQKITLRRAKFSISSIPAQAPLYSPLPCEPGSQHSRNAIRTPLLRSSFTNEALKLTEKTATSPLPRPSIGSVYNDKCRQPPDEVAWEKRFLPTKINGFLLDEDVT